jgi:hypothetical protein
MNNLESDIAAAINRASAENDSNTPDFLLAAFLVNCLAAFSACSRAREQWYGRALSIGAPSEAARMRQFVGWLSADIPELHGVEVPRLAESLDRFLAAEAQGAPADGCSPVGQAEG